MTAASSTRTSAGRRPMLAIVALLVLLGIGLAAVGRTDGPDRAHLGPRSIAPTGLRALVLLLEHNGITVHTGGLDRRADVALVLSGPHGDDEVADLEAWIRGGGTAVVADDRSDVMVSGSTTDQRRIEPGTCTIEGLADLGALDLGTPEALAAEPFAEHVGQARVRPPFLQGVGADTDRCFTSGQRSLVRSEPQGRGRLITVGGPHPFLNLLLAHGDNAAFAFRLLDPGPGGSVAIVSSFAPARDQALWDLVPSRVRQAMAQAVVALALFGIWQAIRLGRPIAEPQVAAVSSSALVEATGRLYQRSGEPAVVANRLAFDARRRVARALGLPRHTDPATVIDAAANRGVHPDLARRALLPGPIADDNDLLRLAAAIDDLMEEITHGQP